MRSRDPFRLNTGLYVPAGRLERRHPLLDAGHGSLCSRCADRRRDGGGLVGEEGCFTARRHGSSCDRGASAALLLRQAFTLAATVYHSTCDESGAEVVCGCAILPIKTTTKGPAPILDDGDDIIDVTLGFFKANVLFKLFQGDRSSLKS